MISNLLEDQTFHARLRDLTLLDSTAHEPMSSFSPRPCLIYDLPWTRRTHYLVSIIFMFTRPRCSECWARNAANRDEIAVLSSCVCVRRSTHGAPPRGVAVSRAIGATTDREDWPIAWRLASFPKPAHLVATTAYTGNS